MNPIYVVNQVNDLIQDLNKDGFGNQMFNILLYEYLSPKVLTKFERISKLAFDYIIETIKMEYNKSFVEYPQTLI